MHPCNIFKAGKSKIDFEKEAPYIIILVKAP